MSKHNYSRPSTTGSTIVKVIAIFLVLVTIAYVTISLVFGSWDPVRWTEIRQEQINGNKKPNPDTPDKPNDDPDNPSGAVGADGAVMSDSEDSGIQLLSALLPREAYAANDIDPKADTAFTLTATVSPSNADDKTIVWTVAWKNGASTWANGKAVSDYGTVTATVSSGATANFVCKQGFGEQMIITATSRDNSSAKGTLTVDYRKRLTSTTTGIFDGSTSGTKVWNVANTLFDSNTVFKDNFGVGTLTDTVKSHKMTITTHTNLRSKLSGVFTSTANQTSYTATREYNGVPAAASDGTLYWDNLFMPKGGSPQGVSDIEGLFSFCSSLVDYGEWEINSTQYNKLRTCLTGSTIDFVITIKTVLQYGATYTASYNVNVLDSSLKIKVESVDVSDSIII